MTKAMAALNRTDRTGIDWCHLMQSRSLKWFKARFKRSLPPILITQLHFCINMTIIGWLPVSTPVNL